MSVLDKRHAILGVLTLIIAATVVAAFTGVLGGVGTKTSDQTNTNNANPDTNNSNSNMDYAGVNESTTHQVSGPEPKEASVTINERGVSPSRYSTKIGDPVKWYNNNSFPVRMEFDRSDQKPVIAARDTYTLSFNGITYYSVYNDDTDELVGKGSIYVE